MTGQSLRIKRKSRKELSRGEMRAFQNAEEEAILSNRVSQFLMAVCCLEGCGYRKTYLKLSQQFVGC